jgi:hypothetical protein
MSIRSLLFTVLVLAGCAEASADRDRVQVAEAPAPRWAAPPPSPPRAKPAKVSVELTAVTLADDCGRASKAKSAKGDSAHGARRCEQTSMQLAITASDASRIRVKSVELFDEDGKSLGTLTASNPTRWSADNGMYESWDELVPAGSPIHASYVLGQPDWSRIGNRWNRTYTLKTVVTIGGVDRTAHKDVTLSAPTALPPNVKT